jgi:Ca-activated chloride channel family protein
VPEFLGAWLTLLVLLPSFLQAQAFKGSSLTSTPPVSLANKALFRKDVDLVLMPVSVLDHSERPVAGLRADQFRVSEDKTSQRIRYFSHDDAPVAVALVLDASASMAVRFEDARCAAQAFIAGSNEQDQFNVILVSDRSRLPLETSNPASELPDSLASVRPDGQTALWDSVIVALRQLGRAPFGKKAVLLITDGGDNHSRTSERELKSVLEEAGVQIYAVVPFNPFATRPEETRGPLELEELASATGGRVISVRDRAETLSAVRQIDRELRDEYVLGYYPAHNSRKGKWHKVKVNLSGVSDSRQFRVSARKGYYERAE